jgi:hypothetical protein
MIAKEKFEKNNLDKLDIQTFLRDQQKRLYSSSNKKNNLVIKIKRKGKKKTKFYFAFRLKNKELK